MFNAGDTVQWTRSVPDYRPDDGWVLEYTFSNLSGVFVAPSVDNGNGAYLVTITAADSGNVLAGEYSWQGYVSQAAERFTIGVGATTVLPDLASSPGGQDARIWARQRLDALEATLAGTATTDQGSYAIEGVSISRMPLPDMIQWRDRLRAEVNRQEHAERLAKGLGNPSNILVRL